MGPLVSALVQELAWVGCLRFNLCLMDRAARRELHHAPSGPSGQGMLSGTLVLVPFVLNFALTSHWVNILQQGSDQLLGQDMVRLALALEPWQKGSLP